MFQANKTHMLIGKVSDLAHIKATTAEIGISHHLLTMCGFLMTFSLSEIPHEASKSEI